MHRLIVLTLIPFLCVSLAGLPQGSVRAAEIPPGPATLPPGPPAAHVGTYLSNSVGSFRYHLSRTAQYCPGLPASQACSWFSPEAVYATMEMSNIYGSGRVGKPTELNLSCYHFHTVNGVTTAQVGVAAYNWSNRPWMTLSPGSLAGILSPDVPINWSLDRHSLAFAAVQGVYILYDGTRNYRIFGTELRDNRYQVPIGGGITGQVTGTLLNYIYSGGTWVRTASSQGAVTCSTGLVRPAGPGRYSYGYNQVF